MLRTETFATLAAFGAVTLVLVWVVWSTSPILLWVAAPLAALAVLTRLFRLRPRQGAPTRDAGRPVLQLTTKLAMANTMIAVAGTIAIPVAIAFYAHVNSRTMEREGLALRYVDIFYRELNSGEPRRRAAACELLNEMKPSVQVPFLHVCASVNPSEAIERAVDISSTRAEEREVRGAATRVRISISEEFVVAEPKSGARVGLFTEIRGTTPYRGLTHYLVVRSRDTEYLLDELAVQNNTFQGRAKLGEAGAGAGQEFQIYVFATETTPGTVREQWPAKPGDRKESNAVSVIRADETGRRQ